MKIALICSDSGSGGLIKYINSFLDTPTENLINLYCGENLGVKNSRYVNIIRTPFANESGKELLLNRPLSQGLIKLVEEFDPEVVVFMNGYMRKGLEKYKCITILHNQLTIDRKLLLKQRPLRLVASMLAVRKAVLYGFKNADGQIFLSHASKIQTDKLGYKYKNGKVILFGHYAKILREAIPSKKEMVYVSTQFPYKNHKRLLKALSIVKKSHADFHVSFVGCKTPDKLIKLTKKLGLEKNVTFCGWMNHEEVIKTIHGAEIYLHASFIESTSNGVLEGVVEGNTIVCSNLPVFTEAVGDTAYYFNPKKVNEIANAIKKAYENPKPLTIADCEKILKPYDFVNGVRKVYEYAEEIKGRN